MKKSALNEKITAKKFVWLKWFMHGLEGRGGGMEGGDEGRSLASRANNLAKGFNSQRADKSYFPIQSKQNLPKFINY